MKNVVVIGGGIIGLCSAYYLHKAGHRVTVIDKGDFNDNCSFGNMGYVCPSHFIPLAAPGIVKQGLKWMLNSRSPFYIQPSLDRSLINWGIHFFKSANKANVSAAAKPLSSIALLSLHEYGILSSEPGFEFDLCKNGLLEMFRTNQVADHAPHVVEAAVELGLDARLVDSNELRQMEPQTEIRALGAIYFKCDAHLNPNKLMASLKNYLKSGGVKWVPGEEVIAFETHNKTITKVLTGSAAYDCHEVVIATGSWSRQVAALLHISLPLVPGRGYSFTLNNSSCQLNHPAILTEGRVAITPFSENRIRFGGTMEIVPVNTPPRYQRVEGIIKAVKSFLPAFDISLPSKEDTWYGFRPCSADGLPYIGRTSKWSNLIVATGHSMLGLSLGAATGKLVNEIVGEEKTSIDLRPFAVERFS